MIITEGLKTSERSPNRGNHPHLWQKPSLPHREFRYKGGKDPSEAELLAVSDSRRGAGGSQTIPHKSCPALGGKALGVLLSLQGTPTVLPGAPLCQRE